MSTAISTTVSCKEADFLDQDPPLRGQKFVCLSFISPEDVIKKKEAFFFEEFIKTLSVDMNDFFENLKEKYPDDAGTLKVIKDRYSYLFNRDTVMDEFNFFITKQGSALEEEYYKQNNFQTTIRGIKVRGVFETLREAEIRSQVLKKIDDKFHVYVAEVGCWCPWSPNPDDIQDQEYAETQLNTMMKHYKDNQDKKDLFYQERKRDLQFAKTQSTLEDKDAWMQQKEASTSSEHANIVDAEVTTPIEPTEVTGEVTDNVTPPITPPLNLPKLRVR